MLPEIRPIRTEADHEAALGDLEKVFDAEPGTPEGDVLEILSTLIEAYENEHHAIPPSDPIETIRFYMEQNNLGPADLGDLLGSRPHASEVLKGKRQLSLDMIRRLVSEWGLPSDALIQPVSKSSRRGAKVRGKKAAQPV
jgi:HTH-type transcriptional regulator / antitoxin HigA